MTKRAPDVGRLAFAVLGVLIARLVGHFALESVPHVMDEIVYTLQARTMASGHLVAPEHLPRAAFAMWFVEDRGATYGIFPPGWPAILALGYLVHLPAWVNPLLHGATAFVLGGAARDLVGASRSTSQDRARDHERDRAAAIAAGAWALCPQAILLAAGQMSHPLVALTSAGVLAAGAAILRGADARRAALVMGAAIGVAVTTRPLCAVIIALEALALLLVARKAKPDVLAAVALPAAAGVILLCMYNAGVTGSPLRFPQTVFFDTHAGPVDDPLFDYRPGCNSLGFGPGHGCETALADGRYHTALGAWKGTLRNLQAWMYLVGFVVLGLALYALRARGERRVRLVVFAMLPVTMAVYATYWYPGTCYGARFFHASLPAGILMAALGVADLFAARPRLAMGAAGLGVVWNVAATILAAREVGAGYWGTDGRFARLAATWTKAPALVLVAFDDTTTFGDHELTTFMEHVPWSKNVRALGALAVNSPRLDGPVVYARYHPGLMRELRARFPDRERWLYVMGEGNAGRLEPYDTSPLPALEAGAAPPKENFDGFVVPRGRSLPQETRGPDSGGI